MGQAFICSLPQFLSKGDVQTAHLCAIGILHHLELFGNTPDSVEAGVMTPSNRDDIRLQE